DALTHRLMLDHSGAAIHIGRAATARSRHRDNQCDDEPKKPDAHQYPPDGVDVEAIRLDADRESHNSSSGNEHKTGTDTYNSVHGKSSSSDPLGPRRHSIPASQSRNTEIFKD